MPQYTISTPDEIFDYIKEVAEELFPDETWSGLEYGSFEWLFGKMQAAIGSLILQYQDLRAKGAYLSTATVRQDIRNIAENLGLVPRERSGATTTLSVVASDDVTIPLGTTCVSANGETFSTVADLELSTATSLTGTVTAVHASHQQNTFFAQGNIHERVFLNTDNVLADYLNITVNGVLWTAVASFYDSIPTSNHYRVMYDQRNRVYLQFGDGVYGRRLSANAEIVCEVFSGGGAAGNSVGAGTITSFSVGFANSGNISTVVNMNKATGGRGAESAVEIRRALPAQLRNIAGIQNAEYVGPVVTSELSWAQDAVGVPGYTPAGIPTVAVASFAATDGEVQDLTAPQATELGELLAARGAFGIEWSVVDALVSPIQIDMTVRLANRALAAEKKLEIVDALVGDDGLFSPARMNFTSDISKHDVLSSVLAVPGVSSCALNRFCAIPTTIDESGSAGTRVSSGKLHDAAEDGYYSFVATTVNNIAVERSVPVKPSIISSSYVRVSDVNWVKKHYIIDENDLDDVNGPYILLDIANKLNFLELTDALVEDEHVGDMLLITWYDSLNDPQYAYYTIASWDDQTLVTTEDAVSPIDGTAIAATFAGAGYSNINVYIIRSFAGLELRTENDDTFTITHNNADTLYVSASPAGKVAAGIYSYIVDADTALTTSTATWYQSSGKDLSFFWDTGAVTVGDCFKIYVTPVVADVLRWKHPRQVFYLAPAEIKIRVE